MSQEILAVADKAKARGSIEPEDVLAMRHLVFDRSDVDQAEAESLFALVQLGLPACPEWPIFFLEAVVDYLVHQVEPHGYVSDANADWLIAMIERDGELWTDTELEAAIAVLEKATMSPPRLVRFVLDRVREATLSADGPTRHGFVLRPGCVGEAEVDLLRRVLYAYGGSGAVAISREEAEALFDINDATLGADNHPSWRELFVKAIASHVLAISGRAPPPREEALRRERWLDDTSVSPLSFFSRILGHYATPDANWADRVVVDEPARVDTDEAAWLRARLLGARALDPNKRALLAFIEAEAEHVHPSLRDLKQAA